MSKIAQGLIVAGILIVAAFATVAAQRLGWTDGDTGVRLLMGMNGLMCAYFGNQAPKAVFRSARAQSVRRVTGWTFVLASLVYTAIWAFAPMSVAMVASISVMLAAFVIVFGYCTWTRTQTPAAQ